MDFQTPHARTDIYKGFFFSQTVRDWNALPDSIISFTEGAEDGVARFTSGASYIGTRLSPYVIVACCYVKNPDLTTCLGLISHITGPDEQLPSGFRIKERT